MRIVPVLLGLVAASAAAFACSGSSTDGGVSGDAGDERGALPDGGRGEGGAEVDSPTGCPLKSTGFKTAKVVKSVSRGAGTAEWTDPTGALAEDSTSAKATLTGQESALLELSDFGFDVPPNALTYGIELELVRIAPQGGVTDGQVNIHIDNKTSRFQFVEGPWPKTVAGTHHYGQAVDTWGVDLFPADVNTATFRVSIWVKKSADATGTPIAEIDALKAAIHYCEN